MDNEKILKKNRTLNMSGMNWTISKHKLNLVLHLDKNLGLTTMTILKIVYGIGFARNWKHIISEENAKFLSSWDIKQVDWSMFDKVNEKLKEFTIKDV